MTANEAIEILLLIRKLVLQNYSWVDVTEDMIRESFNMAISALEPERKKGEWIYYERREPQFDIEGIKTWSVAYYCSECGFIHTVIENFGHYAFCPRCGAEMKVEQDD